MTKMTKPQIADPATTEDLAAVLALTADGRSIHAELADRLVVRGDVAEARAKVAEQACHHLMAAIGPFADYADERRRTPEDYVLTQGSMIARRQLRMRDCYRAADAVQQAKDLLEDRQQPANETSILFDLLQRALPYVEDMPTEEAHALREDIRKILWPEQRNTDAHADGNSLPAP